MSCVPDTQDRNRLPGGGEHRQHRAVPGPSAHQPPRSGSSEVAFCAGGGLPGSAHRHWEEAPHPHLPGTPIVRLGKVFMLARLRAESGVGIEQHTSLSGCTASQPLSCQHVLTAKGFLRFENYRIFLVRFIVSVAVNSHQIKRHHFLCFWLFWKEATTGK